MLRRSLVFLQGIAMEFLTASFAPSSRNAGREYKFTCQNKSVREKQWIPGRVLCCLATSTNPGQCCKFTAVAYPVSPVPGRRSRWRSFAASLNLEDGPAPSNSTPSSSEQTSERLTSDKSQIKDDAVVKFRSELAVLELELQTLVGLAEEIANFDVPSGSRKINGKYIQSHLLSRLEAVHDKVMLQIKDVESLRPREIAVYWVGMAENVQIMGSFDGWSYGESMSREYSGDYARFSATLRLRPGSYEIKFLVDGEWKLSSEYPIAGEGLTQNNKLVVA
ncbi:protein PTST, chloroplastic isoform X3 [Brachypodium distachyon]|uniref:protein PTST, chloroplastic isoform X3 n=1 Tax=Brachypodium distachyon TaxID=15368 RepID=UPI000D0CAA8A|nr:protein PTST, chloroplastic isoform X3 [Brachypodium distachyon]|eukprot:XP_024317937.1 protein PTST, chloroplastic isoform X3 [Brachypodium distachyon]